MSGSGSLKLLALGALALGGLAVAPSAASADGWRHHRGGYGHERGWRGPPPRAYYAPPPRDYYAPPPRAYYYAPPRFVYAPPPPPRHWGYAPRYYRY